MWTWYSCRLCFIAPLLPRVRMNETAFCKRTMQRNTAFYTGDHNTCLINWQSFFYGAQMACVGVWLKCDNIFFYKPEGCAPVDETHPIAFLWTFSSFSASFLNDACSIPPVISPVLYTPVPYFSVHIVKYCVSLFCPSITYFIILWDS